jgi:SAM-dependent methyltransferase
MNPLPSDIRDKSEFDRFAFSYDQLLRDTFRNGFASDPAHFHRRKWLVIQRLLAKVGRRPQLMDWLDVGCGQGQLLELASAHFASSSGCDPSAQMLSHRASFTTRHQLNPYELPYPSQSFDFVTAVCVYHHVARNLRTMLTREIRRVLRPGGLFCIIEHNPYNPVTRQIVKRCPIDAHAELLSLSYARTIVEDSGFKASESEYFLHLPERLFSLLGCLESLFRKVPLGGQYAIIAEKPADI